MTAKQGTLAARMDALIKYAQSGEQPAVAATLMGAMRRIDQLEAQIAQTDTLRHQYIRAALQGVLANDSLGTCDASRIADLAVHAADAAMSRAEPSPRPKAEAVAWLEWQRFADLPEVHEALRSFSEDSTGDNAVHLVRTLAGKLQEYGL